MKKRKKGEKKATEERANLPRFFVYALASDPHLQSFMKEISLLPSKSHLPKFIMGLLCGLGLHGGKNDKNNGPGFIWAYNQQKWASCCTWVVCFGLVKKIAPNN